MPRFLSRKLQFDFDLPVPEKEFLQALGSRLLKPPDAVDRQHQDEMKHFLGCLGGFLEAFICYYYWGKALGKERETQRFLASQEIWYDDFAHV